MITIVSGLPRSGTSLMMQMLEKGGMETLKDNSRIPDVNNPRGYYEYNKAKSLQKDNTWLKDAEGRCVKIIAPLLCFLPVQYEYNILFMTRNMDEMIQSQTKMLHNMHQQGAALESSVLKKTFQKQTDKVLLLLSNFKNVRLQKFSYNEMINNPTANALLVNQFLKSSLSVNAMASAIDQSLYHERL
ncbi:sulfotransferase family protein [bacterium]|nr:sulfotransferase family protein [bacterium]